MPRFVSEKKRAVEAERLRHLRHLLGMSQRQLAREFQVAHGAICLWEQGSRTIPGSVLRLLEIYEDQLGMVEKKPGHRAIRSGWLSRTWHSSKTASSLAARLAGSSLAQLAAGNARATQIKAATQQAIARELSQSLGELKGLIMKFGQMASYMDFALPEASRRILRELQDNTKPMEPCVVESVFERELGTSPQNIFRKWSAYPFAAASIGQVHLAELEDHTRVAVKVQYPGIREALQADLKSSALFDKLGSVLFRHQERGVLLEELRDRVLEECDYEKEASNLEAFRRLFSGDPEVRVPKVFPDYCTPRVLTTEYIDGMKFNEFTERSSQAERNFAGETLFRMAFKSIFHHRLFNCDPHPGNYLFFPGQVAFLDFGCVKRFEKSFVDLWKEHIRAVLEKDWARLRHLILRMGFVPQPENYDFEYHYKMILALYEPWLWDRPFPFTKHYARHTWQAMISDNPNRFITNLPKDWLFPNRLQWGLYSVLAELGAEFNARRAILSVVYEPGEKWPEPYGELG